MHRLGTLLVACTVFTLAPPAVAQTPTARLLQIAQQRIAAHALDSADAALRAALDVAVYQMDSVSVFVWRGILEHLRDHDTLAQVAFRRALLMNPGTSVRGLNDFSPGLGDLFETEARAIRIYRITAGDTAPRRVAGPPVAYPLPLLRRRVQGTAVITAVVDTLGRVEPRSITIIEVPDTGFVEPLRQMLLASTYTPGRVGGYPVRTSITVGIELRVREPPPSNTQLVAAARGQLGARRPDSALALVREVLDTAAHPTDAERVYALLVQGLAWTAKQRDSLATAAFDAALAGYRDLSTRGVELAPFLRRLADSVRMARRDAARAAAPPFPLGRPTAVETVDQEPALLSHPPIRYAPEMQALRIGGTVIVEATLDTTGRVLPATVKIVQSPNRMFDGEARRVVIASVYRPARRAGHAVQVTLRQPITFAAY